MPGDGFLQTSMVCRLCSVFSAHTHAFLGDAVLRRLVKNSATTILKLFNIVHAFLGDCVWWTFK